MARTQSQTLFRKPQYDQLMVADNLPFDAGVAVATPLYEGDLVYWTGSGVKFMAGGALSAANVTQLANFLGLNAEAAPSTYWNNRMPDSAKVYRYGYAEFYQTASDVYHQWDEVMVGADAQTITKAQVGPDSSPAGLWTGTGSSGNFTAAAHSITATYLTTAGETMPGTAASVTLTSSQGFLYDYDNASAYTVPSWATGICIYCDGILLTTFFTAPAGDQTINSFNSVGKIAPVTNALAIGRIMLGEYLEGSGGANTSSLPTSITGVAGKFIRVKFRSKYPDLGLL